MTVDHCDTSRSATPVAITADADVGLHVDDDLPQVGLVQAAHALDLEHLVDDLARREVWRAMRGEGEVDTTALMERSERAQETMREQLETLLGEEDAGRMLEQMRGPF